MLYVSGERNAGKMSTASVRTEVIPASEARQQFSSVLNRVFHKEARVVVERSGIPVAAIVSADDLRRLHRLDAERAERFKVLDEIAAGFEGVSPEEIERETAKALAEVRSEMWGERSQPDADLE